MDTARYKVIRYIYMYLVTAISIVLIIVASIGLIKLVLEEYVFDVKTWEEINGQMKPYECEEGVLFAAYDDGSGVKVPRAVNLTDEEKQKKMEDCRVEYDERIKLQSVNEVKRSLVNWISMLVVSVPLYLYYWGIIQKESKK